MSTRDIIDYYAGSGSVYEVFAGLPQPTVAAITGYCLGGGWIRNSPSPLTSGSPIQQRYFRIP